MAQAFWLLVGVTLALAVIPGLVAYQRRELFWTDGAIVLAPAPVFFVTAFILNPATHVGFGLIIYPYLALAAAVLLAYVRVFAFPMTICNARLASRISLALACVVAFVVGLLIPPLYE